MPVDDLRDAIAARLEDPAARAQFVDALVRLLENAPVPPPAPAPPRGPRKTPRLPGEEPRPEDYGTERSYENAHWKWRRANGIEGGSAPKPSPRPVSWGDEPVSRETGRPSPAETAGDVPRLPSRLLRDLETVSRETDPVSRETAPSPAETGLARASGTPSLRISGEIQPKTVVVVSGVSGDSDAREPSPVSRETVVSQSRVRLPETETRRRSPGDGDPETAGDNNNNSMVVLSPEAERIRKLLCVESDGRIAGVLVGNRIAAFNGIVETLRTEYSDADWVAFARLVRDRKAKWWTGGFALPSLCNPGDQRRTPCYGITRGLEETRKIAAPVRVAAPAKSEPKSAAATQAEQLAWAQQMLGKLPYAAGGGS